MKRFLTALAQIVLLLLRFVSIGLAISILADTVVGAVHCKLIALYALEELTLDIVRFAVNYPHLNFV